MSARFHSVPRRAQRGIAMIESLIAILILGIALVGTLGLQARSVAALSDAGLRAEATIAANQLLGIMNTDIANAAAYAVAGTAAPGERLAPWYAEVRERIPGATITVAVSPIAGTTRTEVDIVIGWQRTTDSQVNQHQVISYLSPAT